LILLPQTYGPFRNPKLRQMAERVVRTATMAWARDAESYDILKSLAGPEFSPERYRSGVDVAFLLECKKPKHLPADIQLWISERKQRVAAINVSGLIYNGPDSARDQYGFRADYTDVIDGLLRRLLENTDWNIVLVPHVLTPIGHFESDRRACEVAVERIGNAGIGRIAVLPTTYDQSEIKSLISQVDWFCGTRMHATIAALSTGVPTAAIAYSMKTKGVFATCGQESHVADPRVMNTVEVLEHLWTSWQMRDAARNELYHRLPAVLERAANQMSEIVTFAAGTKDGAAQLQEAGI
jgi:polysaccharide pyruvyl transferase WcaK-like protein